MKKLLCTLAVLTVFAVPAFSFSISFSESDTIYVETNVNLNNYWEKTNKTHKKVLHVAQKIMVANKINKRTPISIKSSPNTANAVTNGYTREIVVYSGLLPYIENDDELAYVLAHEIAHDLDYHDGYLKYIAMNVNMKKFELKADTKAVDMMVKAGYNPIAAITIANKIFAEPIFDWGFTYTHPKGSKRLIAMYKHILVKYPQYLDSSMTENPYYKNFEYSMAKEIKGVQQDYQKRQLKQERSAL